MKFSLDVILGTLILTSTIIGLGIFTLPYTLINSGIYFYFWILVIPVLILIFHLAYSEIIFKIEKKHNLPQIASFIINRKLKLPVWFFDYFGLIFVFWVYLIVMNNFLIKILGINFDFKLIISFIIVLLILFEENVFSKIDAIISLLLIFLFIFISFYFLGHIDTNKYSQINKLNFWLPYGILLFSYSGYHSLQLVYDLIKKNKKKMVLINIFSLLIVTIIYLFFTLSVVGAIDQEKISPISLFSLIDLLPSYFKFFIIILFLVSIVTTFLSLAFYLKRGLISDFNINNFPSWLIVSFSIILLSFFNYENIIKIIGLIGDLFIGFNILIILFCYLKLKEKSFFYFPPLLIFLIMILIIGGWINGLFLGLN
jgi:amino acid permease